MERLHTVPEVAGLLRASNASVYRWAAAGKLRSLRAGKLLRFRPEDVEDFLRGRRGA